MCLFHVVCGQRDRTRAAVSSFLTHAERVRVGHAGSDFHLAVGTLGADLARFGAPQLLGKTSGAASAAQSVSLRAALADESLAGTAGGARRAQAVDAPEEEAAVAFALRVLGGGAGGQLGDARRALGTGRAGVEPFGGRKGSWEADWKLKLKITVARDG